MADQVLETISNTAPVGPCGGAKKDGDYQEEEAPAKEAVQPALEEPARSSNASLNGLIRKLDDALAGEDKENPLEKKKKKKKRRKTKDKKRREALFDEEPVPEGRRVLCTLKGSMKGKNGLEIKHGAVVTGIWAYRPEHLDTSHALKFTADVSESAPGTFTCKGYFIDDPVLWGANKKRDDSFILTVGPDGRASGKGESFYGPYDVVGSLHREERGNYATLTLHKMKPLQPWIYDPCMICGADDRAEELVLCDGGKHDTPCPHTAHLSCLGLSEVPDGDWFCPDCMGKQCGPECICRQDDPGCSKTKPRPRALVAPRRA